MGLLSADEILGANDIKRERVSVPEWGGDVLVASLPGSEKDAFNDSLWVERGKKLIRNTTNLTARLIALCIVDEAGQRLFKPDQIEALGKKSAVALERVEKVARKLNGIGETEFEDLAKNSDAGTDDLAS